MTHPDDLRDLANRLRDARPNQLKRLAEEATGLDLAELRSAIEEATDEIDAFTSDVETWEDAEREDKADAREEAIGSAETLASNLDDLAALLDHLGAKEMA